MVMDIKREREKVGGGKKKGACEILTHCLSFIKPRSYVGVVNERRVLCALGQIDNVQYNKTKLAIHPI
jgi:hypothetical protein